jgi:hypothetical protein
MSFRVNAAKLIPAGKEPPCDGLVQLKLQVANSAASNGNAIEYQSTSELLSVRIRIKPLPECGLILVGRDCQKSAMFFKLNDNSALVRALTAKDVQIVGQELYTVNGLVKSGKWGMDTTASPPTFWVNGDALGQPGDEVNLMLKLRIKDDSCCLGGLYEYEWRSNPLAVRVNVSPTHTQPITNFSITEALDVDGTTKQLHITFSVGSPLREALRANAVSIVDGSSVQVYVGTSPLDYTQYGYYMALDQTIRLWVKRTAIRPGIGKMYFKLHLLNHTDCGPGEYYSYSDGYEDNQK